MRADAPHRLGGPITPDESATPSSAPSGGHRCPEAPLRTRPALLLTVACTLGCAGTASAQPGPAYGETLRPAPTVAVAPTTPPVTVPEPAAIPQAAGPTAREVRLGREVARLRAQLARERAAHRRMLRRERLRSLARSAEATVTPHVTASARHAIALAAATYGVPAGRLLRVATCESGLDPSATSGPYLGLFQFGTPLWVRTPYAEFSRGDAYAAAMAASWAFSRGMFAHWPVCGRR